MKKVRKLLSILAVIALILSITVFPAAAVSLPGISIDGTAFTIPNNYGTVYTDSTGRIMAPIRAISEKLGATVSWDQAAHTAIINGNIKVTVGASAIVTPYGDVSMDTISVIKNDRIYVPVRFLCSALGYNVEAANTGDTVTANIITKVTLTISAAASLKDAMAEVKALYQTVKPNSTLIINFGASGTLQTQIEQGAAVDLFFSAATKNMNTLKDKGLLIDSTIKNILGNEVVLVAPVDSKLSFSSFSDVTNESVKKIALGEPASVPAGQYAEQVFKYLNILDAVKTKAVYGSDVKQVLTYVESGNVECGVVYSTDAKVSTKVKVVATSSSDSHTAIVYPAAVIKTTKNEISTTDFLNFLSSDAAKAVFVKYGFTIK